MTNPLKISLKKGAFEKQDKVFPNYRENDMKNKSETDFSERRLKWAENANLKTQATKETSLFRMKRSGS